MPDEFVFRRVRSLDESERIAAEGQIRLLASTDAAVDWGGWREVLSHAEGAIDLSAARSLLINHDADQLAGGVSGMAAGAMPDGLRAIAGDAQRALMSDAEVDEDARMRSGMSVRKAVKKRYLNGVSIGYTYEKKDTTFDEASRTLHVHRWRLLEISLTPIPADARAQVRAFPFERPAAAPAAAEVAPTSARAEPADPTPTAARAALLEARVSDPVIPNKPAAVEPPATIHKDEGARAAVIAEQREIAQQARSVGLESADYVGLTREEAKSAMLTKLAERNKTAEPKAPVVQVTRDAGDAWIGGVSKALTGARDGLHLSNEAILRRCARFDGIDEDMNLQDLAGALLRRMSFHRSANKTSSAFSNLMGSTANKQLLAGFDKYAAVWPMLCTVKDAKDFNSHPNVGVSTGRLSETKEGSPFPELTQKEGAYSSQLKMFGATMRITVQALVNDTLGEIMRSFYRTGYVAARTIDYQVFYALLNGTWTYDVTSSAGLGTAGNFDKARADFKKKLGPAGEKMEIEPGILVVDPINRYNADLVTGQLYGIGVGAGNSQLGSNAARALQVADSTFVGDTNLLAGALTTDYYLFGDPNVVDTVALEFLLGQRVPMIEEFDSGAVAAVSMKTSLPFAATLATHSDGTHTRNSGIQKAQA